MHKRLRAHKKIMRDKEQKAVKREKLSKQYSYDNTFRYRNYVEKLPRCLMGVSWKASVQYYYMNCIVKMFNDHVSMMGRKLPKPISTREVIIYERGKQRIITPIHIKDRLTQKVLCDYCLTPLIAPKLIYDNGASLTNKGVTFSRRRLKRHLLKAIKEYGSDFYVLSFDFKEFFDSVPHKTCRIMLEKFIDDKDIVEITMEVIKSPFRERIRKIKDKEEKRIQMAKLDNDELKGMCLGSQVSQVMALLVANDLDHYIKDTCRMKYYDRYMDDGIIMAKTKEELHELYSGMKEVCDKLGLNFNTKKTHITKIRKGFTFLKVKYSVTESGKVVRRLTRKGITRMRRKLKKFRAHVDEGRITLDNVYDSMQSWLAHSEVANSYHTVKNMMKLYNGLFDGYKISKEKKNVLQADKWSNYRWCRDKHQL